MNSTTRIIQVGSIWSKTITEPKTQQPREYVIVYRVTPGYDKEGYHREGYVYFHLSTHPNFPLLEKISAFLQKYELEEGPSR